MCIRDRYIYIYVHNHFRHAVQDVEFTLRDVHSLQNISGRFINANSNTEEIVRLVMFFIDLEQLHKQNFSVVNGGQIETAKKNHITQRGFFITAY